MTGQALPVKVMSFDPGKTTGWCKHFVYAEAKRSFTERHTSEGERHWAGGQIGPDEHHDKLYNMLAVEDPKIVVCEAFNYQIRKLDGVQMPGIELISREYIGVLKLWCQLRKKPFILQQPSILSIEWCKDPALAKLGIYTAGEPHHNDATRHMLHFIVDEKNGLGRKDYLRPLRH